MRKGIILIIALIFLISFVSVSFGREAPHDDDTNNISCTDCHSKFNIGSFDNSVCLSCHINDTGGGYSKNSAPKVQTHHNLDCIQCHHNHYQRQIVAYASTEPNKVFLVEGTITSIQDNGDGTTTIGYNNLIVNNSNWADPATWVAKTKYNQSNGNERGLILVDISNNNAIVSEVIAATTNTITLKGSVADKLTVGQQFGLAYGLFIRDAVTDVNGVTHNNIKIFDNTGVNNGLAYNENYQNTPGTDPTPNGLCQICHTTTKHWRNDGSLADHNNGHYCVECHKHETGFTPNCGGCHGSPPVLDTPDATNGLIVSDINGTPANSGSTTSGAHDAHVNGQGLKCENCHTGGMLSGPSQGDNKINIGFSLNGVDITGTYKGQVAVANGPFPYAAGNTTTTIGTADDTMECSNLYCHGATLSVAGDMDGGTDITPQWNQPSTGACGTCHGATNTNPPVRGSHYAHAGPTTDTGQGYQCSLCHKDPSVDNSLHVDQKSEVIFSSTDPRVQSAVYTGTDTVMDAYGTCTNVYCHSNVQTSPPGGAVTYKTVTWGNNFMSNGGPVCNACHEGPADHQSPPLNGNTTGSHLAHANNYIYCGTCHAKDPTQDPADTTGGCNVCHGPADEPNASHADYSVDVVIVDKFNGGGASYSGTPTPGDAYGSCSNVYCHSTVQADGGTGAPTYATPTWGDPATGACGTCHAQQPSTGSHTKHLSKGLQCSDCHYQAGDGTALHANKNIDVKINPAYGVNAVYDAANPNPPQNGYASCTNVYCHSDGQGNYKTVTWGSTSTGCDFCHGNPPATGAHSKHVISPATTYGDTSVNSVAGNYDFGCGNCHPTDEATYHRNGKVDLSLDKNEGGPIKSLNGATSPTAGYNQTQGTSVTCTLAYCHSNGAGGANQQYKSSPDWYGGTFGANKCGSCHDNPPQYSGQSHYVATNFMGKEGGHLIGIHWDSIYDAQNGGLLQPSATDGSHGDPTVSTTISCYICHNGEVSDTQIDTYALNGTGSALECANCHTATSSTPLQSGMIIDKSLHVNGKKDVNIADAFTIKSKAQLRNNSLPAQWARYDVDGSGSLTSGDYKTSGSHDTATLNATDWNGATKTCTTACHLGQPVQWGDQNVTCNTCHKGL